MTSRIPSPTRRLPAAATFLTALVLATSACTSGQASPTPAPVPSTSASASASPAVSATPTAAASYKPADANGKAQNVPVPVLPEVAKKKTKEGLEAFARYWYSTLSFAYETGDIGPLQAVSASTCASCSKVKKVVEGWHSEGRWLAGGKMTVEQAHTSFAQTAASQYQVVVQVRQEPVSYYRADKTLDETTKSGSAVGDIMVAAYGDGAWKAITVEHLVRTP